jgi:phosphatidate cytidylyltransferase
MSNTLLRIITSIILLPIFILILHLNNNYFLFLLTLILFISTYEIKFFLFKKKIIFLLLVFLLVLFIYSLFKLRGDNLTDFYNLIWIMSIVWLSDIGGFVAGRLLQGPKLTKWSPNKTIAGFFGSIIFSQLSFLLIYFVHNTIFTLKIFIIQVVFCLVAIVGDIFFSFIKRKNNLKDYSKLIPGHGGLLDRIDGLIFVIILAYFLKIFNVY